MTANSLISRLNSVVFLNTNVSIDTNVSNIITKVYYTCVDVLITQCIAV